MYSLSAYATMIADRVRTGAYAEALRKVVKPGSVVLEIGTGPGIFAILACQIGAGRVFAIEASEIIQIARENAASNGCGNRIEFFEDLSTKVTLPVRADIIVSDLHGILPLFGDLIPSIMDARHRFLSPGGILIPRRETLQAAVVNEPKLYAEIVDPWERNVLDQDLRPAHRLAVNQCYKARFRADQLLTAPQVWATLDYLSVESPDVFGELRWSVEHAGTGHGFVAWFETDLAEGVGFSNAPGTPETIFGSLFFPWVQPVRLGRGDEVRVHLEARLTEKDYEWRWSTQVKPVDGSDRPPAHFDQSTLGGSVISLVQLRKRGSDFVPQLSDEGLMDRRALDLMDGHATLEQIARDLAAEFPQRFSSWQNAMTCAGDLSRKYSR